MEHYHMRYDQNINWWKGENFKDTVCVFITHSAMKINWVMTIKQLQNKENLTQTVSTWTVQPLIVCDL